MLTLNDIITIASGAYPDDYISQYWNFKDSEPELSVNLGDTLARFIACELADSYDYDENDDSAKLSTAIAALESAVSELQNVIDALRKRSYELQNGEESRHDGNNG